MNQQIELKPMPLWMALLCFGGPAVIGILGLYVAMPAQSRAGVSLFWTYMLTVVGMFPLLLGVALVAYRLEGRTLSWSGLKRGFRIGRLSRREWLWTAVLLVVFVGGQLLLLPTAGWVASTLPQPLPEGLPHALDPRVAKTSVPGEFPGVALRGNWGMALVYLPILVFNIVGEVTCSPARSWPTVGGPGWCTASCGPCSTPHSGGTWLPCCPRRYPSPSSHRG